MVETLQPPVWPPALARHICPAHDVVSLRQVGYLFQSKVHTAGLTTSEFELDILYQWRTGVQSLLLGSIPICWHIKRVVRCDLRLPWLRPLRLSLLRPLRLPLLRPLRLPRPSSATLTEVFPCFFLTCKADARVWLAKTGHGSHSKRSFLRG